MFSSTISRSFSRIIPSVTRSPTTQSLHRFNQSSTPLSHFKFYRKMSTNNISTTPSSSRGCFIVLEGLDRSGKSTQCKLLTETMNGNGAAEENAVQMRFPGKLSIQNQLFLNTNCYNLNNLLYYPNLSTSVSCLCSDRTTPIGIMIDSYLRQQSECNDQAIHLLFVANRWEAKDRIVQLLNEGKHIICDRYSYSGIAFSSAKGLSFEWCQQPEVGLPEPDIVFYLTVPSDVAENRGQFGEERYEKREMQDKVRKIFQSLHTEKWKTINAARTIEEIQTELSTIAKETAERVKNSPIDYIQASKQ